MRQYILVCAFFSLLGLSIHSEAAVRSVTATDRAITPIYLRLGRSTVLRFREKPRKVVLGNQNYFNVEFIENDLAIQPTGAVTTNLFVYGEFHTYGFALDVGSAVDDLVHVEWSSPTSEKFTPNAMVKSVGKQCQVGPKIQVRLESTVYSSARNLVWGELSLLSHHSKPLATTEVSLTVSEKPGGEVKTQLVCEGNTLRPFQKSSCRVFFPVSRARSRVLKIKFGSDTGQINF